MPGRERERRSLEKREKRKEKADCEITKWIERAWKARLRGEG